MLQPAPSWKPFHGSALPIDADSLYRFSWLSGAADGLSAPRVFKPTNDANRNGSPVYVAQQMVPLCSVHPFVDCSNSIFRNAALGLAGCRSENRYDDRSPSSGLPTLRAICRALVALAQDDDEDEEEDSGSNSDSSTTLHEANGRVGEDKAEATKVVKAKKKRKSTAVGEEGKGKKALSRLRGQRVIARCNLDGYYYAGNCLISMLYLF